MPPQFNVDALLDDLAERVAERVATQLSELSTPPPDDGWMNSNSAAEYLGISRNALHKHTSERTIPFEQDGPRGRLYFSRADLDEWRRGKR